MNYILIILIAGVSFMDNAFADYRPGRVRTDLECVSSLTVLEKQTRVQIQSTETYNGVKQSAVVLQSAPNALYRPLEFALTKVKYGQRSSIFQGDEFLLIVTQRKLNNKTINIGTLKARDLNEGKPLKNLSCQPFIHTLGVGRGIVLEEAGKFEPVEESETSEISSVTKTSLGFGKGIDQKHRLYVYRDNRKPQPRCPCVTFSVISADRTRGFDGIPYVTSVKIDVRVKNQLVKSETLPFNALYRNLWAPVNTGQFEYEFTPGTNLNDIRFTVTSLKDYLLISEHEVTEIDTVGSFSAKQVLNLNRVSPYRIIDR